METACVIVLDVVSENNACAAAKPATETPATSSNTDAAPSGVTTEAPSELPLSPIIFPAALEGGNAPSKCGLSQFLCTYYVLNANPFVLCCCGDWSVGSQNSDDAALSANEASVDGSNGDDGALCG